MGDRQKLNSEIQKSKPCLRCGKLFTCKRRLNEHLDRKRPCHSEFIHLSCEEVKKDYYNLYHLYMKKRFPSDSQSNSQIITSVVVKNLVEYKCEFCSKKFSQNKNYLRHKRDWCKVIKEQSEKDKKIENLQKENEELKEKLMPTHERMLRDATIIRKDYEKEDKYIIEKKWQTILNKKEHSIMYWIEHIYIDAPQNRTVYIPDINATHAECYIKGEWTTKPINKILGTLFINGYNDITDRCNDKLGNILLDIYNSDSKRKDYEDRIKLCLVNNRNMIK